ncbi:MAG: DCC1-like thiol-disulfide oxidoreductase family protein [Thermoanaerobaculia bacterium]
MPPAPPPQPRHLLLFDGVCGLCHRVVLFTLDRDPAGLFAFAPLAGPTAREALAGVSLPAGLDSVILVKDWQTPAKQVLVESDAALAIAAGLPGAWRWLAVLRFVPRAIRDRLYRLVARHRYRLFGRFETCRLPGAVHAERFLP